MTTLEAKPMAFFFSPFSPLLGTRAPVAGASVPGTAALSIRLLSCSRRDMRTAVRLDATLKVRSGTRGEYPNFAVAALYILYMSDAFA